MTRIELVNLFLTKEALYRLSYMGFAAIQIKSKRRLRMERETRLELATFSLEG